MTKKYFSKLNLIQRFSILSFVCIFILTVVLAYLISYIVSINVFRLEKDITPKIISGILEDQLSTDDFSTPVSLGTNVRLLGIFSQLDNIPGILTLETYSTSGKFVWSNEGGSIKKPDLKEEYLKEALNGNIVFDLVELSYKRVGSDSKAILMVIPVRLGIFRKVSGISVVYKDSSALMSSIKEGKNKVWMFTSLGGIIIYISLFWIVYIAHKRQKRLEEELVNYSTLLEKRVEERTKRLKETSDYLDSLIENSADAIITTGLEGNIISWSKSAENMYGWKREEVIGKRIPIIPDNLRNEFEEIIKNIKKGNTYSGLRTVRQRKDGNLIDVSITLSPVYDNQGKVYATSGITRDISKIIEKEETLEYRNRLLALRNEISAILVETLNLNEMLDKSLKKIIETMNFDMGHIRIIEKNTGDLVLTVYYGVSDNYISEAKRTKRGSRGYLVIETGEPFIMEKLDDEMIKGRKKLLIKEGARSLIRVPLKSKNNIYGAMGLACKIERIFLRQEIEMLTDMGIQIGTAMENIYLYNETKDKSVRLEMLAKIAHTVTSTLEKQRVFDSICEYSKNLTLSSLARLWIFDELSDELIIQSQYDPDGFGAGLATSARRGKGLVGWIMEHKEPLIIYDAANDLRVISKSWIKEKQLYSFIGIPLLIKDKVSGVLSIFSASKRKYSEEEINILKIFADQAVIAINNADLFEQLNKANEQLNILAITDGLTDLFNHRYFQELFLKELERAKRFNTHLSLIIADIDYFKNYNDNCGHPQGDMLLKTISEIMRSNVRSVDTVARYGGEEFTIILPETNREGAMMVAEKLRQIFENHPFPYRDKQPEKRITVSFGIATYPDDSIHPAELISIADERLYKGKRSGRNRVVCL